MRKLLLGIVLALLLASVIAVAFYVQLTRKSNYVGAGPIYIRTDGTIDPSSAPIQRKGNIYTLTGNITTNTTAIIIQKNNVTIDGAGYTLNRSGINTGPIGFNLTGIDHVTIKDIRIVNFDNGIWLSNSSSNNVSGNNVANNGYGFRLNSSSNNNVNGNDVTANTHYGIELGDCSHNNVTGNTIENNEVGIWLNSSSSNNMSRNNIVDNQYGIVLYSSNSNAIYHNSFINSNTKQVASVSSVNIWDDGFRGNYWNDYSASYPNAKSTGDTWNTPYAIEYGNVDHHPIVNQP